MNIIASVMGGLVFLAAAVEDVPLASWVFGNVTGWIAVIQSVVALALMWFLIGKRKIMFPRILAAFQVTMIIVSVTCARFPDFVMTRGGENLSLLVNQAPTKTMEALGYALLIGSMFILPALFYLYWSFQRKEVEQ